MAKDKRVEVLFDPADYRRLEEVARREGKPVGAMIREAVEKYVTGPSDERRHQALQRLLSMNSGLALGTPEELKEEMSRTQYEAIVKSMNNYDDKGQQGEEE
jgi:predicted DNA-binding protein